MDADVCVFCPFFASFPFLVPEKEPLEQRYDELMRLVAEIGKDIKPAYTNSKVQSDRLRKSVCVRERHC